MAVKKKGPGWHGIDFDGTLATHGHVGWPEKLGEPIPKMVHRIQNWLENGEQVKILTARVFSGNLKREWERKRIERWCQEHIGRVLPVTSEKDHEMIDLYDDRARQIRRNTGELVASRIAAKAMNEGVRLAVRNLRKVSRSTP